MAAYDSGWSSLPVTVWWRNNRAVKLDRWDVPPHLVYVPSGNQLRLVDLAARTINTIFETPEPIGWAAVPMLSSWSGHRVNGELSILVRTRQRIDALDRSHRIRMSFTIPTEIDHRSSVTWHELGRRRCHRGVRAVAVER